MGELREDAGSIVAIHHGTENTTMEAWQHHFQNVMADGDVCFDGGDYEGACQRYQSAFKLIPDPQREFPERCPDSKHDKYRLPRLLALVDPFG